MLYITTRGTHDAFTAYRTTHYDTAPDGGFFVPMKMPVFSRSDVLKLSDNSFGQNVAETLNYFFGTKISAWDVDVAVGRRMFSVKSAGHRTLVGQLWNNVHGDFPFALRALAGVVCPDLSTDGQISNWLEIGIRIAVIFAVFGELLANGSISYEKSVDIAVPAGSFAMPMALWYARSMGLPIRTVICGCNENGAVWDLLHRGTLDTGVIAVKTTTPECDFAVPPNLERLIHGALGTREALHYWWTRTEGRSYSLEEMDADTLSSGMFAAVVSMDRVSTIVPSVYRTNRYILDPYGALAYGALSDYRARTGSVGSALVLTERSPVSESAVVCECMHIAPEALSVMMSEG